MRKTYIDNIRWITIVLVVIYHVIYMFNGVETAGVLGTPGKVQLQDTYLYIVYPWFMLLLFVVSGMSARFYLDKHTHKEFVRSKTRKLLVPSTIGLLVFWWILGYLNLQLSGAYVNMAGAVPGPILFLIMASSGIGPMWYIQTLWLLCLLLVLIRKIERDRFYEFCSKANIFILLALVLITWGGAQLFNTPVIIVYRFGIYGAGNLKDLGQLYGYFREESLANALALYLCDATRNDALVYSILDYFVEGQTTPYQTGLLYIEKDLLKKAVTNWMKCKKDKCLTKELAKEWLLEVTTESPRQSELIRIEDAIATLVP